jgi:hypothetical protein
VDEPHRRHDWNPATSQPGEIYTVEGRIASAGAFARGLANPDARAKAYRRSAVRFAVGWAVAGAIIAFVAAMLLMVL